MFIHHRQQELIKLLLQDQKWHNLSYISECLGCSEKTVRRDLLYLKDFLPTGWQIHSIKGKGVKLDKPPYLPSSSVYFFFKKNNMIFKILDQLFQRKIDTVVELADALYVQVSSLSLLLGDVQNYLIPFKLHLKKKPLRIEGTEPHIVYMFYELYFNTYKWESFPFPGQKDIFLYIEEIEQNLNIQFYPIYRQRLAYLLAISIQRKKQGYPMDILPIYKSLVIDTLFYEKIKTIPYKLCGISLTEMDYILITIAINCFMFTSSDKAMYKQKVLKDFYKQKSTIHQYTGKLVKRLENEFQVAFNQDEEFVFYLSQYIKQISYRHQFIPAIASPTSEEQAIVKSKHCATFQKVEKIYTEWVQKHPYISYVYTEDIMVITLQVEATLQLTNLPKKKALLYLGDSISYRRYIQSVLYKEFGQVLAISTDEVLDIHSCDITKLGIDFILTTVPLGEIPLPVIQMSVIPTRRELYDLKKLLNENY